LFKNDAQSISIEKIRDVFPGAELSLPSKQNITDLQQMRIAYFTNSLNSFVNLDLHLLGQFASVKVHAAGIKSKIQLPIKLLSQLFFIVKNIYRSDLFVCQFAGYTSLLPTLCANLVGKKCVIVVGGTDTAKFPALSYGNFTKSIYGLITKWSYQLTSAVIAPHSHLIESDYEYCEFGKPKQGIKVHYPGFNKPSFIIPNVVHTSFWNPGSESHREGILTVALNIESERIRILKGIDLLIELGSLHPHLKITVTGYQSFPDTLALPPNVQFLPVSTREELKKLYQEHRFYAQLSVSEGWGVALCEAMSCGCVPIVSKVGAMPSIVSDSGYVLENRSIQDLDRLFQSIKEEDIISKSRKANSIITSNYDASSRSKMIKEAILSIIEES